jgi:hypothetical protein
MMEKISLNIATPKGIYNEEFSKTAKIQDVITATIKAMSLDGGDAFDLVYQGKVLQPVERPLVSFGLEGTVQLELVATGSGV